MLPAFAKLWIEPKPRGALLLTPNIWFVVDTQTNFIWMQMLSLRTPNLALYGGVFDTFTFFSINVLTRRTL